MPSAEPAIPMSESHSEQLTILSEIRAAFREEGYAELEDIQCQVDEDGLVELSGTVPSFYLKQVALTSTRRVDAVIGVRNRIHVQWPTCPSLSR